MDESWNTSLLTGDQCAICENPLGDDSMQLEQGEELLQVCGSCALKQTTGGLAGADPGEVIAEAEARSRTVQELLSCRADEQSRLEEIGQFIENLARALSHWQRSAGETEQRARSLEAEVSRLRERVQRAEALMSSPAAPTEPPVKASPAPDQARVGTRANMAAEQREESQPAATSLPEPHFPEPAPPVNVSAQGFEVEDLRLAQRFFSESLFTEKTRSVRRSLGKPIVNLTAIAGPQRQILATVAWEIVWYQYLITLDEELDPAGRVTLFGEGMELGELGAAFSQPNAILDDEGRIDASELEFSLLGDSTQVIDDQSPEQVALEDATEEIWDRHTAPEFRWDD